MRKLFLYLAFLLSTVTTSLTTVTAITTVATISATTEVTAQVNAGSVIAATNSINNNSSVIPDGSPIVVEDYGQSNDNGRGEADRLALLTWPLRPSGIYIYVKPTYTNVDDGAFQTLEIGGNTEEPNDIGRRLFGGNVILAIQLKKLFPNSPVYVIPAGEGGTSLGVHVTNRDWGPASNECFTRAFTYMHLPAMADIEAANPGKRIFVFKMWHQGEEDAQSGSLTAAYAANFTAFDVAVSAVDPRLANAPWFISKLDYNRTANETTINNALQNFVNANSTRAFINDFVGTTSQKIELTTAQRGGFAPTSGSGDDIHQSYLAQIWKGTQHYPNALTYYSWPNNNISEITRNIDFNVSSISTSGLYLPVDRVNTTITPAGVGTGLDNSVTVLNDALNSNHFNAVTPTSLVRFKVGVDLKGSVELPSSQNAYFVGTTAQGTSYFGTGIWSIGFWYKPLNWTQQVLFFDADRFTSAGRSRLFIRQESDETVTLNFSAASATTLILSSGIQVFTEGSTGNGDTTFKHLAFTSDGSNLRMYLNGTLLATTPITGMTASNYVNAVWPSVLFVLQSAAATFTTQPARGYMRSFVIQPVTWSAGDIQNIMKN